MFRGFELAQEARFRSLSRYGQQSELPKTSQIDMIGLLTKLTEGLIIGRSDKSRESFATI